MPGASVRLEVLEEGLAAQALGQVLADQKLARLPARGAELDARRAGLAVAVLQLGQLVNHLPGLVDAPLRLGGAGLRAPLEPLDLALHLGRQGGLPVGLRAQVLLALHQEGAVGAVDAQEPLGVLRVQLDDARGDVLQEHAVVADEDEGERGFPQQALQPHDAFQIQVVRRLVYQQQFGLADEGAGQGRAASSSRRTASRRPGPAGRSRRGSGRPRSAPPARSGPSVRPPGRPSGRSPRSRPAGNRSSWAM